MKFLSTLILLFLFSSLLNAETFTSKVIDIIDGDTFIGLVNNQTIKIRIYGIDAPEEGQPFGQCAKDGLFKLIFGQQVQIEKEELDQDGLIIGKVIKGGNVDIGASLVAYGHAWVNRRYINDPYLLSLQEKAEEKKVGLWALPMKDRTPPWAWKHGKKYKNIKFVFEDTGAYSKNLDSVSEHDLSGNTIYYNGPKLKDGYKKNYRSSYNSRHSTSATQYYGEKRGCGSRGDPGWRKPNGKCASWED